MATSSITHNFVVSNPNSVKRFVAAIDEADRDRTPKQTLPGRQLTNPQDILALMSKRKKKHSLTIKTISVRASNISKTMAKKLSRVSILDEETQSYTTAAYLIAQLGKNYSLPKEKRIPGNILLGFALETISSLKYSVGGVMEFLECEDNEFLLSFYTQNHFKPFDTRITASQNNEPHTLHQLLKFI